MVGILKEDAYTSCRNEKRFRYDQAGIGAVSIADDSCYMDCGEYSRPCQEFAHEVEGGAMCFGSGPDTSSLSPTSIKRGGGVK